MEIIKRDIIDFEPLVLTLFFENSIEEETGEKVIIAWYGRKKQEDCPCDCQLKHIEIEKVGPCTHRFLCQWLCRDCIMNFMDHLRRSLGEMRRVEIGIAADDGVVGEDWVHVEGKTIVFEDGGKELVRPFLVRRDLVTVAEYEEFCAETGYKTVAELAGDEQTYLNSLEIYGVSRKAMKATAAKLFAFKDVVAYCRWKRARLPSEAEWLAAAIHDERILPMPKNPYQTMKLANEDKALNFVSFEFTSSTVMGQVVIRNGPKKVRFEEWNSEIHTFHHRRPIDPDEPNDDASIRLCRDIL